MPLPSGGITTSWLANFQSDVSQFVSNFVVQHLVPTLAAFFLLRAVLDAASGQHPLPSILAAMFLLGTQTTYSLLQSYNTGTQYATVDVLDSLWNHLAGTIMPIAAVLALVGAILNFATRKPVSALGRRVAGHADGFGYLETSHVDDVGVAMNLGNMSFDNGVLHLTNWLGNVIMPTLAAAFIIIAILQFSKGQEFAHSMYGALALSDGVWLDCARSRLLLRKQLGTTLIFTGFRWSR